MGPKSWYVLLPDVVLPIHTWFPILVGASRQFSGVVVGLWCGIVPIYKEKGGNVWRTCIMGMKKTQSGKRSHCFEEVWHWFRKMWPNAVRHTDYIAHYVIVCVWNMCVINIEQGNHMRCVCWHQDNRVEATDKFKMVSWLDRCDQNRYKLI